MLANLRARNGSQGVKEPRDAQKSINFQEEYHTALRTKSYADFLNKAQLLEKQPSIYFNHNKLSEILLEPGQDTLPSIVDTAILSEASELKNLVLSYFDISAEASHICSHLLKSIEQVQSNHLFFQRALDIMDNDSPENFKLIIFELNSFIASSNPFLSLSNGEYFKLISDKHSLVLHHLKSMRKKVGRKIKFIKYLKKTSGICITAACGIVAITCESLMKELRSLRFSRSNFLSKVRDQLDIAAKGTCILNRDLETMSRLVARLHGEIEHSRAMVQFCLDRKEDKFSSQIVKQPKKSDAGFRKQVEQVWLLRK